MCTLYSDVDWSNSYFKITESSAGNCDYPMYFGILGMILYGFLSILYNGYAVFRSFKDKDVGYVPFVAVWGCLRVILDYFK